LTRHVVRMKEVGNAYKKEEPRGKPKRRWKDNIETDLREIEWEDADRLHLMQDRDQW